MNYPQSVQKAIDYIEEHLHEPLELAAIANEAHLSLPHLYRLFYALTGHPIKDYIRKRRVSVAACQLKNSARPIADIAWDSGFETYHSFAKTFKKIVGMTPAMYRRSEIYFSFEHIRLFENVVYMEDKEQSEKYPDVKVVRLWPTTVLSYRHIASQPDGIETEAFQTFYERIRRFGLNRHSRARYFGYNFDPPSGNGTVRYGYVIMMPVDRDFAITDSILEAGSFEGGLYAVCKTPATSAEVIVAAWDRLLSEWLPKSTFTRGTHQYVEEFIEANGKIARMNLYLPIERKTQSETIEIVDVEARHAAYSRGYGERAQAKAERSFIAWFERMKDARDWSDAVYYMSYSYGNHGSDDEWWENGISLRQGDPLRLDHGVRQKTIGGGRYACVVTGTYGMLTGVLERMYRWIAANGNYRLDEERQWFAEYHPVDGTDIEKDTIVKVFVPVKS